MLVNLSLSKYAEKLSAKDPAPGGGSAAALSGLLGVSLLEMVINLTVERAEFAEQTSFLAASQAALATLHQELEQLIDLDATAFSGVIDAYRLPKNSENEKSERLKAIQTAVVAAAEIPLRSSAACLEALHIARSLLGKVNPHAASDLVVGSLSCHTGAVGALLNTAINMPLIKDQSITGRLTHQLTATKQAADSLVEKICAAAYAEVPFTIMK